MSEIDLDDSAEVQRQIIKETAATLFSGEHRDRLRQLLDC